MKKLKAKCFYFREVDKTALCSYATGSNTHQGTDKDKNKQKYGNKPEIGWVYFQIMETNREVLGMLLILLNRSTWTLGFIDNLEFNRKERVFHFNNRIIEDVCQLI